MLAAAILSIGATIVASLPARADVPPQPIVVKPGLGWAGEWHFTGANYWSYSMAIPGVSVTGTGYDSDDIRYFNGTLTDTSPSSDLCAYLTFAEGGGAATYIACDGTVTFSQFDDTPGTYQFTFALRNASNMWRATSYLTIPSTKNHPELRASGNGAGWHYVADNQAQYSIVRPGAIVSGIAYGIGYRTTSATIVPSACTETTVSSPYAELASKTACSANATISVPSGIYESFTVRNCLAPSKGSVIPAPTKCVPLIVM